MEKSKRKEKLNEWRSYLLHYECVRRNNEFKKGYEEWKRASEDEFSGEPFLSILRDMLASQWGLLWGEPLPDPKQLLPLSYITQSSPPESFVLPKEYSVDPAAEKGMQALQFLDPEKPANLSAIAGLLVLTYFPERRPELPCRGIINLRLSKKSIMKSFETHLDAWLEERKCEGLKQWKPARRVRLEAGIKQLEVYDLHRSGLMFSQVGATVFQGEKGNLEKKAMDHFSMAKRLIENPPLLAY